jgi:hypothetical protein
MSITTAQWQQMSYGERIEALQAKVGTVATHDQQTQPATVYSDKGLDTSVRGRFDPDTNSIRLNPDLLGQETPYAAMETLFHEYRHSYQQFVANERPDLAESPQQLEDFQKNTQAYIRSGTDYTMYRSQPIEVDARNYARQQIEANYGMQQDPQYAAYRQERDATDAQYNTQATRAYGPDHEAQAREIVYDIYDLKQAQQQATAQTTPEPTSSPTNSQSEEEEHQRSQGRRR